MSIIHGKQLTDDQAASFQSLWEEWMTAIDNVPARQSKPTKEYQLDGNNKAIKALEKKYIPLLAAILNAAPDASAELAANG